MVEEVRQTYIRKQRNVRHAQSEYILGKVKSQISTGPKPAVSIMVKNLDILLKTVPFAGNKAEEHFNKTIELLSSNNFVGRVSIGLPFVFSSR